jgi:hypothetical protein
MTPNFIASRSSSGWDRLLQGIRRRLYSLIRERGLFGGVMLAHN